MRQHVDVRPADRTPSQRVGRARHGGQGPAQAHVAPGHMLRLARLPRQPRRERPRPIGPPLTLGIHHRTHPRQHPIEPIPHRPQPHQRVQQLAGRRARRIPRGQPVDRRAQRPYQR
jgi:hypothetical protein